MLNGVGRMLCVGRHRAPMIGCQLRVSGETAEQASRSYFLVCIRACSTPGRHPSRACLLITLVAAARGRLGRPLTSGRAAAPRHARCLRTRARATVAGRAGGARRPATAARPLRRFPRPSCEASAASASRLPVAQAMRSFTRPVRHATKGGAGSVTRGTVPD